MLNLTRAPGDGKFTFDVIAQCVADNAAQLVELRLDGLDYRIDDSNTLSSRQLAKLIEAAPRLKRLYADARTGEGDEPEYDEYDQPIGVDYTGLHSEQKMVDNEPPFGPLRIVNFNSFEIGHRLFPATDQYYEECLDAMVEHTTLTGLRLYDISMDRHPEFLPFLARHPLSDRLTSLSIGVDITSAITPTSLPWLTAILGRGIMRELVLGGSHELLVTGPHAAAFREAVRTSPLERLQIINCCLLTDAASVAFLNVLIAHPTLSELEMGGCARAPGLFGGLARRVHTDAPAALARLVGTNAPALRKLELPCSSFVDGFRATACCTAPQHASASAQRVAQRVVAAI